MLRHHFFLRSSFNQVTVQNIYRSVYQHVPTTKQPQQFLLRSYRSSARTRSNIQPAPMDMHGGEQGALSHRNVVKALLFTGAFSIGCFSAATILEYENTRRAMMANGKKAMFTWLRKPSIERDTWSTLKDDVLRYWNQLTPGEKVFVPLCAINLIVFTMWHVPSMRGTMMKYFTSNPAARVVCWPMFLSTFSHYSALHIFANMYVLHSFSNAAVQSLGQEQFLAVYLSAGVVASFASIFYKTLALQSVVSLGASGAIMAILAYVCAQYPETQLSILFLPTITFSAGSAIKVIMGLDFAGCVMGWRFFDHAAHLGGAMYGILWAYFGEQLWAKRITLLNIYHDFRKTK